MKLLFALTLLATVLLGQVSRAGAAERKSPENVDVVALTKETQKSADPTNGFNLVWILPVEYWQVSLAKNKNITQPVRRAVLKALQPYVVVGIVRADISPLGAFKFYGEKAVLAATTVNYIDADGKTQQLSRVTTLNEETEQVISSMKPILRNAMGKLGSNFHFMVYRDRDAKGRRIASPYVRGKMSVTLHKIGNHQGGTFDVEYPLDSLHVARRCEKCSKEAHVSWHYCPQCGTKHKQ